MHKIENYILLTNSKNQHHVARDFANGVKLLVPTCMCSWCYKPYWECARPDNSIHWYFFVRLPNIIIKHNNWKKLYYTKTYYCWNHSKTIFRPKIERFQKELKIISYQVSSAVTCQLLFYFSYEIRNFGCFF